MEHSLDESLNLESSIDVDFEQTVVEEPNNSGISLESTSQNTSIPMEFQNIDIEEQPILMETGNEEIIDFMGDQFGLQEYSVQDDQITSITTTMESNTLSTNANSTSELQFNIKEKDSSIQPKIISVKAAIPKLSHSQMPREVAIAPKPAPPKLKQFTKTIQSGKQFAIAPKPISLIAKPSTFLKKVSIGNISQNIQKGKHPVFAQIGKQLVMLPSGGGAAQKLKLVTSSGSGTPTIQYLRSVDSDSAQLSAVKTNTQMPKVTKVLVPNQTNTDPSNQPAVISKLYPATKGVPTTRVLTVYQKTVPISSSGQTIIATGPKQEIQIAKKQLISLTSPTKGTTKKVIITANPAQNVVLKPGSPNKNAQEKNETNVLSMKGQRMQLHQVNVPGKGIQYVSLLNPNASTAQSSPTKNVAVSKTISSQPKTFVLADGSGNLIQMTTDKISGGQPPPLLVTANAPKSPAQTMKKFVRIAPVGTKMSFGSGVRSSQSLLAPMTSSVMENTAESIRESEVKSEPANESQEEFNSKNSLHTVLSSSDVQGQFEIEFERDMSGCSEVDGTPLIVVSNEHQEPEDEQNMFDDYDENMKKQDDESYVNYYNDSVTEPDLAFRARKPCNCTKSQCLKLYCDCFANGEFCNNCNCFNCHNNLNNEELRQKAIRGCLERNPNAFKPKIGKANKSGGPDVVRRHTKGCNCKRSGCLKNYCECYEAKIACTAMCKCVGCRNVQDSVYRRRREVPVVREDLYRPHTQPNLKQPCSFMTGEVIEAVCQCLVAAAGERAAPGDARGAVLEEFARCLADIMGASLAHHQARA